MGSPFLTFLIPILFSIASDFKMKAIFHDIDNAVWDCLAGDKLTMRRELSRLFGTERARERERERERGRVRICAHMRAYSHICAHICAQMRADARICAHMRAYSL